MTSGAECGLQFAEPCEGLSIGDPPAAGVPHRVPGVCRARGPRCVDEAIVEVLLDVTDYQLEILGSLVRELPMVTRGRPNHLEVVRSQRRKDVAPECLDKLSLVGVRR